MARYDYECKNCGVMELEHSMTTTQVACPRCGDTGIKKLVSRSLIKEV
jgi:putative FmdB family regulatory protein